MKREQFKVFGTWFEKGVFNTGDRKSFRWGQLEFNFAAFISRMGLWHPWKSSKQWEVHVWTQERGKQTQGRPGKPRCAQLVTGVPRAVICLQGAGNEERAFLAGPSQSILGGWRSGSFQSGKFSLTTWLRSTDFSSTCAENTNPELLREPAEGCKCLNAPASETWAGVAQAGVVEVGEETEPCCWEATLTRVMGHIDVGSKIWSLSSPPSHSVDNSHLRWNWRGKMKMRVSESVQGNVKYESLETF